MTKCVKCEHAGFSIQEISPSGAQYKMFAVQCGVCQTPIGVTDFWNVGSLLKEQEKAVADLEKKIDHLQYGMSQVVQALQSMRR